MERPCQAHGQALLENGRSFRGSEGTGKPWCPRWTALRARPATRAVEVGVTVGTQWAPGRRVHTGAALTIPANQRPSALVITPECSMLKNERSNAHRASETTPEGGAR